MIIVIADDITGAAEMGGIALRHRLSTMLSDELNAIAGYDVVVLYTNTRSMREEDAAVTMRDLTLQVKKLNASLFYKKTDSVLRGHVLAEMKAHMEALRLEKGLLVPVNPSNGRVIKNGQYFINGVPADQTSFSIDPAFPIRSSRIEEMLTNENIPIKVIRISEALIENGISVGEAETDKDLRNWASYYDGSVLLAGGGSFFNALLESTYQVKKGFKRPRIQLSSPVCLVSGTTFNGNVERIRNFHSIVSYMPADIFSNTFIDQINYQGWADEVSGILTKHRKAIIAIDNRENKKADPDQLTQKLAAVVELINKGNIVREWLIEGGATAYAIVSKLGWQSFIPSEELGQGIVRMQVVGAEDLHLTIKPGSYEWPPQWNFN